MDDVLTIEEAAKFLKLDPQTIGRKLRSGELPGRKIGGAWRLSTKVLESFFAPNQSIERDHATNSTATHGETKEGAK